MKKKSFVLRLGVMALALTLVTTSLSSGTLAKYTKEQEVEGKVVVAHWNPTAAFVKEDTSAIPLKSGTSTATFDIADLRDSTISEDAVVKGMVAPGTFGYLGVRVDTAPLINKGTEQNPNYKLDRDRRTEVAVDYRVNLMISGGFPHNFVLTPVQQKTGGGWQTVSGESPVTFTKPADYVEYSPSGKDDDFIGKPIGTPAVLDTTEDTSSQIIWFKWEWPYEASGANKLANDEHDTNDGEFGLDPMETPANMTGILTFTVEMVQHDPTKPITQNGNPVTYWSTT